MPASALAGSRGDAASERLSVAVSAVKARDVALSLVKAVYARLFDWLVARCGGAGA